MSLCLCRVSGFVPNRTRREVLSKSVLGVLVLRSFLLNNRPKREVAEGPAFQLIAHATHSILQFEEVGATQFECVFVRLERCARWVIHIWRACVLDVCAQDVPGRRRST